MSSDPWVLFQVSGMSCGGCERSVSKALGRLPGFSGAEAEAKTGRAWVQADPSKVEDAKAAITKAGFTVSGFQVVAQAPQRA